MIRGALRDLEHFRDRPDDFLSADTYYAMDHDYPEQVIRQATDDARHAGVAVKALPRVITISKALSILGRMLESGDDNPKSVLTPPELAREWGISSDKVLGWIRSGQLKARNVSNGIRPLYKIERDDLKSFRPPAEKLVKRSRRKPDPSITQYY